MQAVVTNLRHRSALVTASAPTPSERHHCTPCELSSSLADDGGPHFFFFFFFSQDKRRRASDASLSDIDRSVSEARRSPVSVKLHDYWYSYKSGSSAVLCYDLISDERSEIGVLLDAPDIRPAIGKNRLAKPLKLRPTFGTYIMSSHLRRSHRDRAENITHPNCQHHYRVRHDNARLVKRPRRNRISTLSASTSMRSARKRNTKRGCLY